MDAHARSRFQRLTALFETLCALPPPAREPALARACGEDSVLADELRSMLAADVAHGESDLVWDLIAPEAEALTTPDLSGTCVGAWTLVRPIGEGGMGQVYLAERTDGAFEALAAIKLVHSATPGPNREQRFVAERQILAGLTHRSIARLLDGGTTHDGRPYLVMEFVDGAPVTAWCDDHTPTLEARLRVFMRICDAVAYAHRQLVAHLDLKPSNIMVDRDGEVKLLDFGISKLLDATDADADPPGDDGPLMLMTPAYASPEQITGATTGVATDVYALGAVLFEMLTGQLPLRPDTPTQAGWTTAIVEQVPPLASAVARPAHARALRGDLDAIVAHALHKDPEQRYRSVQRFSEDIRRHLRGYAVQVRHAEIGYRASRFLRRHALAIGAAAAVVLGSVGFGVYATAQARALAQERDLAQRQRMAAQRVGAFLEQIFTEADPSVASGQEVTVREVLDHGAARVLAELQHEPEVRAAVATVIGRVYRKLGEFDAAAPLLDDALATRLASSVTTADELATTRIERAALHYDQGDLEAALALLRTTHADLEAAYDDGHVLMVDTLGWMATTHADRGHLDEAQTRAAESLRLAERFHEAPDVAIANAMNGLAAILRDQGKFDEALPLNEAAVEQFRSILGDTHLDVAHALNHLAQTLSRSGHQDEALARAQQGLAIRRAVFPGAHPETAASLGSVAGILVELGRFEEAEAARLESLTIFREVFGPSHPYVAGTLSSLGSVLVKSQRYVEAEQVLRESIAMHAEVYAADNPKIAFPLTMLGRMLLLQGRAEEAEAVLRRGLEARVAGLPAEHWHIGVSSTELGRALDALHRDDAAEEYLLQGHQRLVAEFGEGHARVEPSREALRDHYTRRGLPERAAAFADGGKAATEGLAKLNEP